MNRPRNVFGESPGETILIVEDNRSLREGLGLNLRLHGYQTMTAADGETGLHLAFRRRPDLIVLDLMLPDISGLDLLRDLRRHGEDMPVLILSARSSTTDKVAGLDIGADDYLAKPFDLPELIARVGAMLRRRREAREQAPVLRFGVLTIDPGARRITVQGRAVDLSAREFDLLYLLAAAPGVVFSREKILARIWGWDYEGTERTVDNFIAGLRKKIEPDRAAPRYIRTVPKVGYCFDEREPG